MKDRKLAVRYARALLASLPDLAAAARAGEFLSGLVEAVEASPELKDAFLNPAFGRGRRKDILRALGAGRDVPSQVSSFLQVVADNNRLAALPTIAAVFAEERERAAGVVAATVTTAAPIAEPLQDRLTAALERLSGRKVRLTATVDPSLVGGAVARIGSTLLDGSVRTQLDRLGHAMAQE